MYTIVADQEHKFHCQQRDITGSRLLYILQATHNFRVIWCLAVILSFLSGLLFALPLKWGLTSDFRRANTEPVSTDVQGDMWAEQDLDWVNAYYSSVAVSAVFAGVLSDLHNMRKWFGMMGVLLQLVACGIAGFVTYRALGQHNGDIEWIRAELTTTISW